MNKSLMTLVLTAMVCGLTAQDTDELERMQQFSRLSQQRSTLDYRLGPGDLIEISVFGVDNFDREYRVTSSGSITVPFLGKILVGGKSGEEVESEVASLISARDLIHDPQVSVFVKEFRSQPVYVLGAVNQPGQFMTTRQLTILDAIAMAGGIKPNIAEDFALVQPQKIAAPLESIEGSENNLAAANPGPMRVDLRRLMEKGDLTQNISIRAGDVINIPERRIEIFYVVGEVGKAGAYELPRFDGREFTATEALAWAGGPGTTANTKNSVLVRYTEDGQHVRLAINFDKILKGKEPDFAVYPRDVIFVPGSTVKRIGEGLINIIPGTIQWALVWSVTWGRGR